MSKSLETIDGNQNTVTCAKYLDNGERLLTGSLDMQLKIYKTDNF